MWEHLGWPESPANIALFALSLLNLHWCDMVNGERKTAEPRIWILEVLALVQVVQTSLAHSWVILCPSYCLAGRQCLSLCLCPRLQCQSIDRKRAERMHGCLFETFNFLATVNTWVLEEKEWFWHFFVFRTVIELWSGQLVHSQPLLISIFFLIVISGLNVSLCPISELHQTPSLLLLLSIVPKCEAADLHSLQ